MGGEPIYGEPEKDDEWEESGYILGGRREGIDENSKILLHRPVFLNTMGQCGHPIFG